VQSDSAKISMYCFEESAINATSVANPSLKVIKNHKS